MPSYAPHTADEIQAMLATIGAATLDDLFSHIPEAVRLNRPLELPQGMDEASLYAHLAALAAKNTPFLPPRQLMGGGLYAQYQPAVLDMIYSRSEFLTAYTPYQPEISQGLLQIIYEYQTMIAELTGLAIANASSYDGGTALGDALGVLKSHKTGSDVVLVSTLVNPQYRQVLATYNYGLGLTLEDLPSKDGLIDLEAALARIGQGVRGIVIQNPNFLGLVENPAEMRRLSEAVHAAGGLVVISSDPVSQALLVPPGALGADIAVGETQPFGNTPNFGGPVLGYFACAEHLMRKLPGRVVGMTTDDQGRRAYVLTLSAREQHIRREKATSNLCTNQALNMLGAAVYLAFYGRRGLPALARRIAAVTHATMHAVQRIKGVRLPYAGKPHFREFVLTMDGATAGMLNCRLEAFGLSSGIPISETETLLAFNETHGQATIEAIVKALESFHAPFGESASAKEAEVVAR